MKGRLVTIGKGHGIERAELVLVDDQHHETSLPAIQWGHDDRCHHGNDEQDRQQQSQEHRRFTPASKRSRFLGLRPP